MDKNHESFKSQSSNPTGWEGLTGLHFNPEATTPPQETIHNFQQLWTQSPERHVIGAPMSSEQLKYDALDEITALSAGLDQLRFDVEAIDSQEDGFISYYTYDPADPARKMRLKVDLTNATTEFGFSEEANNSVIIGAAQAAFSNGVGISIYGERPDTRAADPSNSLKYLSDDDRLARVEGRVADIHAQLTQDHWRLLDSGYTEDQRKYFMDYTGGYDEQGTRLSVSVNAVDYLAVDAFVAADAGGNYRVAPTEFKYLKQIPALSDAKFRYKEVFFEGESFNRGEAPDVDLFQPSAELKNTEFFPPIPLDGRAPRRQEESLIHHPDNPPTNPLPPFTYDFNPPHPPSAPLPQLTYNFDIPPEHLK